MTRPPLVLNLFTANISTVEPPGGGVPSCPETVTVFAPVKPDRQDVTAHSLYVRAAKRAREPAALQEWRARMATTVGAAVMRRRKRIELVNAHIKTRGLGRLLVRGLTKVTAVLRLHALAHNLTTAHRLRLAAT